MENFVVEELPNSSETENMRKIYSRNTVEFIA